MKNLNLTRILLITFALFILLYSVCGMDIPSMARKLYKKVSDAQIKKSSRGFPPFSWQKDKGLFESHVKLYFHGSFSQYILRQGFEIYDNNNFASAWITMALLEMHKLDANETYVHEDLIFNAVHAIGNFADKNRFNSSVCTFWPQEFNGSVNVWQSTPQNLLNFFALVDDIPWSMILKFLQKLGIVDTDVIKTIEELLQEK